MSSPCEAVLPSGRTGALSQETILLPSAWGDGWNLAGPRSAHQERPFPKNGAMLRNSAATKQHH